MSDLNRRMAKALGWRVRPILIAPSGAILNAEHPDFADKPYPRKWDIREPDTEGYYRYADGRYFDDPESAWEHLASRMHYDTDLNAVASDTAGVYMEITRNSAGHTWVRIYDQEYEFRADDESEAVARLRCWLAWKGQGDG